MGGEIKKVGSQSRRIVPQSNTGQRSGCCDCAAMPAQAARHRGRRLGTEEEYAVKRDRRLCKARAFAG